MCVCVCVYPSPHQPITVEGRDVPSKKWNIYRHTQCWNLYARKSLSKPQRVYQHPPHPSQALPHLTVYNITYTALGLVFCTHLEDVMNLANTCFPHQANDI